MASVIAQDEQTWKVVVEPKTIHVGARDGLPPNTEYPVGTVIESPDGLERFRLDLVPTRTNWTPVEAHEPEKIDYSRLTARQLIVAIQNGDEEAGQELDNRLSSVAAPTAAPAPPAAAAPDGFEEVPGQPGTFRRIV